MMMEGKMKRVSPYILELARALRVFAANKQRRGKERKGRPSSRFHCSLALSFAKLSRLMRKPSEFGWKVAAAAAASPKESSLSLLPACWPPCSSGDQLTARRLPSGDNKALSCSFSLYSKLAGSHYCERVASVRACVFVTD